MEGKPEAPSYPERLIPVPLGRNDRLYTSGEKPFNPREHSRLVAQAPDLDNVLRKELKDQGRTFKNVDIDKINLALVAVEEFRDLAKDAEALRKLIKHLQSPSDLATAFSLYGQKRDKINEYLSYGLSFEKAYRDYVSSRADYFELKRTTRQMRELENELNSPSFQSATDTDHISVGKQARVERIMGEQAGAAQKKAIEQEAAILATIYDPKSAEYQEALKSLKGSKGEAPRTKKDIQKELEKLTKRSEELWDDEMVQRFWTTENRQKLQDDFANNRDVLETQSAIGVLNTLHDWEQQHTRTTIGGVLVGPPGVGKSTIIRHYLMEKGRQFVYMDLSEDTTRYLLFGSKAIEFKSPTERFAGIIERLNGLSDEHLTNMVDKMSQEQQETLGLTHEQAVQSILGSIGRDVEGAAADPNLSERAGHIKSRLVGIAQNAYQKELGEELLHVVKRNGWRDGVIIDALRNGKSVIMDEFNQFANWTTVYSLLTAKPGEVWHFADNNEDIVIPRNWRMYFTANIGRQHGGFKVPEAFTSRAEGKSMEVGYPPVREEMELGMIALSNPDGNFLRSEDDLGSLYLTISELFPKIRKYIETQKSSIPISFRTIRDLGEKLIHYRDNRTNRPIYRASNVSFDQALYSILVESYSMFEELPKGTNTKASAASTSIPREIVNLATSIGLMLDPSIKDKVLNYIDESEYNKRVEAKEKNKESKDEIIAKIRGQEPPRELGMQRSF